jgi:hypothetical protein
VLQSQADALYSFKEQHPLPVAKRRARAMNKGGAYTMAEWNGAVVQAVKAALRDLVLNAYKQLLQFPNRHLAVPTGNQTAALRPWRRSWRR